MTIMNPDEPDPEELIWQRDPNLPPSLDSAHRLYGEDVLPRGTRGRRK